MNFEKIKKMACLEISHSKEEKILKTAAALFCILDDLPNAPLIPEEPTFMNLRKDIVEPSTTNKELLKNAPLQKDGYFVLPFKTV